MTNVLTNVNGIEAPLKLLSSHDISNPGFESMRRGEFVDTGGLNDPSAQIDLRNIDVLGTELSSLTLGPSSDGERILKVEFNRATTEADAFRFILQLADAWSASLAHGQRDSWYGNLYVHILWSRVKVLSPPRGTVGISTFLKMTSTDHIVVDSLALSRLRWSPLTDIFVEGMKSSQPKSKFLFWFIVLEELEQRKEFVRLFDPMFTPEEKAKLQEVVRSNKTALQRLNGLLNTPTATIQSRSEKLAHIIDAIGSSNIAGQSGKIEIDQKLCSKLINQRNKVAHKGESIDGYLLYSVLFPLSLNALNYILDQDDQNTSVQMQPTGVAGAAGA